MAWRRGTGEVLVHPKLGHFFLMLWYVCKVEHVVRNYTRVWVDQMASSQGDGGRDIASLCSSFSSQEALLTGMYRAFRHGCDHVLASLEAHVAAEATSGLTGVRPSGTGQP
jgi:hypothetical protein